MAAQSVDKRVSPYAYTNIDDCVHIAHNQMNTKASLTVCGQTAVRQVWELKSVARCATCFDHPLAGVFEACRLLDTRYAVLFRPATGPSQAFAVR